MRNLEDKVAFVTGGANGIGLGIVRNLLAEGMKVVIADYNPDYIAAAREKLRGSNAVHFIQVDVSDRAAMKRAAQETLEVFGKIHVLCNNAGVSSADAAEDPDFEDWDRTMSINLGGVVNGVKTIVPIIRAQGEGGHVVNTASMAGMVPLPGWAAYSTTKYAVRGLSESLRMSLAPEGIGVSCLFPGATDTNITQVPEDDSSAPEGPEGDFLRTFWAAMRQAMDPKDLGALVVQAIKDNRFYILTHPEFLAEVKDRHREIEAEFAADAAIPEARAVFEQHRRETVVDLMNREAKD
jgi:NAD(P)-dependent dehydrogenase (short-subunit alcohol dehydrogenase family)